MAVMQIATDGVKIKPFIFNCLSVAHRNISQSHYDRGRFQILAIMTTTL